MDPTPQRSRWRAILSRRCPKCLEGAVYHGFLKPNLRCPECGLSFEREPGYFLGSFYVSYGLGAAVAIPTVLIVLFFEIPVVWLFPIVFVWVGVLGPLIVSYSRVLWYHLDHSVDPR